MNINPTSLLRKRNLLQIVSFLFIFCMSIDMHSQVDNCNEQYLISLTDKASGAKYIHYNIVAIHEAVTITDIKEAENFILQEKSTIKFSLKNSSFSNYNTKHLLYQENKKDS